MSLLASIWAGLVHHGPGSARRGLAMLMVVAVPLAVMILLSLVHAFLGRRNRPDGK